MTWRLYMSRALALTMPAINTPSLRSGYSMTAIGALSEGFAIISK
jgi:hypothetical protein